MFVTTHSFFDEYEPENPGCVVVNRKCDLDGCSICKCLGYYRTNWQICRDVLSNCAEPLLFFPYIGVLVVALYGMGFRPQ